MSIDPITQLWIRNASDDIAVKNGCHFDVSRGAFTVWWIERYCRLYEGEFAGQPVLLRSGLAEIDEPILDDWDDGGEQRSIERARIYADWIASGGAAPDWQYECTMRLFGWAKMSKRWERIVRRFTAASIWVPKKAKKTPSLASWGTYLICGDGEQGAKCFGGAKDGTQAGIAMAHAIAMVEQSPELSSECKINKNERSIEHIPTRSKYKPLSSANERSKNSKEGINGHILIDECFVAGTMIETQIGKVPIDQVQPGATIYNATGIGVVEVVTRRFARELYRLEFSDGTQFVCTKHHPIFTEEGWVEAGAMEIGSFVYGRKDLQEMRNDVSTEKRCFERRERVGLLRKRLEKSRVLLSGMQFVGSEQRPMVKTSLAREETLCRLRSEIRTVDESKVRRICQSYAGKAIRSATVLLNILQQEAEKPYAQYGNAGTCEETIEGDWPQTYCARRERARVDFGSGNIAESSWAGVGCREVRYGRTRKRQRLSHTLQIGPGARRKEDLHRGGRIIAQYSISCRAGSTEGRETERARLVRISRIESESDVPVFNLQVTGHPSYFANGKLVHNCHVVDRDFIKIISRAGISRAEPLHIEVSTAGNNPDGYGKERQDYARQVLCGAEKNDQMFVAIYEAPQSLSDKDLDADPIKYGKMANPAWGHTSHEEEYMADYLRSKRSISELADFKMYRLNIWQHTSNQWLRLDQWLACGGESKHTDFAGYPASAGLDLSKTRDMSALSVSIPVGSVVQLFVWQWMTEAYIEANKDNAAFKEWVAKGHLIQVPGDTIQESFIRNQFEQITKDLDLKILVKDRAFAADFTEWCEEKFPKILQVDYPQNALMMEKPIDDFEAAVNETTILHNNNPCLNWQASHASVFENARGFRIIQKPKRHDYRKVDGMVASVMSYWGTKHLPKKKSVYNRRGVLTA